MPLLQFIKRNKLLFIILLIVVLFLVGRTILLRQNDTEIAYTVTKEALVDTIQVSGTYTTAAQTQVFSPAKGIITELFVANKQSVSKGDPLFHIESTATDKEKAAARADYQNAINAVKIAQQNKKAADAAMWAKQNAVLAAQNKVNYKNDNTTNPDTKEDYTQLEKEAINAALIQARKDFAAAEQKYKEADVAVAAEQAELNKAQLAYDATQDITVNSPANGMIVNLKKQTGDQVSLQQPSPGSTAQTNITTEATPPVLVIADLSNPTITADIDEAYVSRIAEGNKAKIVFDALKDKAYEGHLESIDTVGTETNGFVTYTAQIAASQLPKNIRPNMTALITIETLRKEDVLTVPNSAIISKDNKLYVKKASSSNELIEIKRGIKGSTKSEITDGLAPGTVISATAGIE